MTRGELSPVALGGVAGAHASRRRPLAARPAARRRQHVAHGAPRGAPPDAPGRARGDRAVTPAARACGAAAPRTRRVAGPACRCTSRYRTRLRPRAEWVSAHAAGRLRRPACRPCADGGAGAGVRAGLCAGARARRADSAVQRGGGRSAARRTGRCRPARSSGHACGDYRLPRRLPARPARRRRPRSPPRSTSSPPPSCCWPPGTSTPAPARDRHGRFPFEASLFATAGRSCRSARRRSTATRASCATSSTGASPSWAGRRCLPWTGAAARSPSLSRTTSTTCSAGPARGVAAAARRAGRAAAARDRTRARFELEGLRRAAAAPSAARHRPVLDLPAAPGPGGVAGRPLHLLRHRQPRPSHRRQRPGELRAPPPGAADAAALARRRGRRARQRARPPRPGRAARRPRLPAVGGRRARGRHALPLPALPLPRDAAAARRGRLPLRQPASATRSTRAFATAARSRSTPTTSPTSARCAWWSCRWP